MQPMFTGCLTGKGCKSMYSGTQHMHARILPAYLTTFVRVGNGLLKWSAL